MVINRPNPSFTKRAKNAQERLTFQKEWIENGVIRAQMNAMRAELNNPCENSPGYFIFLSIITDVVIVTFQEKTGVETLSFGQQNQIASDMKSLMSKPEIKPLIHKIAKQLLWPQPQNLLTETHYGHVKSINDKKLIVSFYIDEDETEERYFDVKAGYIKSARLKEGDPVQAVCSLETKPPSPPLSEEEIAQWKKEADGTKELRKKMRERQRIEEEEKEEETNS